MSLVKLLCRYQKNTIDAKSKEIEEELKMQELIQGDSFNKELERDKLIQSEKAFDYGPMVVNLKDIQNFNHVDSIHTCIRFYNTTAYTFKIPFEFFEAMYQTIMGIIITDYTIIEKADATITD